MSPQKRPSPDRQNMLYSPQLQGMGQPVRFFKSSTRTIPCKVASEKPLPPIPKLPKTPSSSSVTTIQSQFRSTGFSLWEPPSNWDNGEDSQTQSTLFFAARHYSPIIPEPPEDIAAMQLDSTSWQLNNGPFPQTPLHPIHERTMVAPRIPARNPSRLSLSLSTTVLARQGSNGTLASLSPKYPNETRGEDLSGEIFKSAPSALPRADFPSPLDLASALSDDVMKGKALPSFSLGSPYDRGIALRSHPQYLDSLQPQNNAYLDLQGHELKTFRKGSILAFDGPPSTEDPEISNRTQALSFAQDYHKVLVNQYQDGHTHPAEAFKPKAPPNNQDLTPRPLSWKKDSGVFPPVDGPQHPQTIPSSSSERHRNLKKMGSWVSHHLKKDSHTGRHQKPSSMSEVPSQQHIPESEIDRLSKNDKRLKGMVQHGKDLVARKVLRRECQPKRPLVISSPTLQLPLQSSENSPLSEAPFQLAIPLFRLPGGHALVRNSPTSTPRPHTASGSPTSPLSASSWPDFPASSPFRFDFSRRSSWQSSQSRPQSQGASTAAIKSRIHSFVRAPSSPRSFSYSTTSFATSAQQAPSPLYTPQQQRRRSHNVGSPLTSAPSSRRVEQRAEESLDDAPHKFNLLKKAKSARGAWKKHQKDIKTEKLKQSIRLLGPADARDVAGYIQGDGKVDGRASGDSGTGEGQLPEYVVG